MSLCWGLLLLPLWGQAQPYLRFERVAADKIGYTVKDILTDRFGIVWLATHEGVLRYDGYRVRSYRRNPRDPGSLSHNDVNVLAEGPDGHIWIGTDGGGLDRLDPETGQFTHYMPDLAQPSAGNKGGFVTALHVHTDGRLWMSTYTGGLYRLDPARNQLEIVARSGEAPGPVSVFHSDARGRLWLGGDGGTVYQIDPDTGTLMPFDVAPTTARIRALASDGTHLWVGTEAPEGAGGLYTIDVSNWAVRPIPVVAEAALRAVHALAFDGAGALWIGTARQGLYRFNPAEGTAQDYVYDAADPNSLSNNTVRALHAGADGMLWVGTDLGGLNKLNTRQSLLGRHRLDAAALGLREADVGVYAVHSTRAGTRWLGTLSGLVRMPRGAEAPVRFPLHPDPAQRVDVYAIAEDAAGTLWLGTGVGLIRFVPGANRARPYPLPPLPDHRSGFDIIYDVYIDPEGLLWLATNGAGLLRFDPATETFARFLVEETTEAQRNFLISIAPHTDGTFWVGSTGGLNSFDPQTGRHTAYRPEVADLGEFIMTQLLDAEGQLWLGTFDGGLVRLDPQTGTTHRYVQADGLPSNAISALFMDPNRRLWITFFEAGLACFDTRTMAVTTYDQYSGALSYFNQNAQFSLPDGRVLLGGVGGLNEIDPAQYTRPPAPALLIETVQGRRFQGAADIESPSLQQLLPVAIKVLDYVNPEKNRCSYRVEGMGADWNTCQQGYETFGSLGEFVGQQTVHLRGVNSNGISAEARVTLSVPIPWWKQMSVRAALVLGVLGFGWTLLYLWERRKRGVQQRQQEALEEARQKEREELASWVHDGPLADLVGLRFVLEELYDYALPEPATARVDDVRDTLLAVRKSLRNVCGTLQMPNFEYGLAFAIRSHATMFQTAHPALAMHLDMETEEDDLTPQQRRYLFLIYLTAMNNVVKHADAANVWVRLKRLGRRMVLDVEDDGCGFTPPKRLIALREKQNYGLLLAETHARSIGGLFTVRASPGAGTTISVETGVINQQD